MSNNATIEIRAGNLSVTIDTGLPFYQVTGKQVRQFLTEFNAASEPTAVELGAAVRRAGMAG